MDQTQNPGSFMSASAGGQNGQGSALMRLMQLRQQGASPQAGNNVPLPAAPVQTGSPVPAGMGSMAAQPPQQQQPQQPPVIHQPGSYQANDPNLQIALQAMSNYIQSHGKSLEVTHNVPMKTAQAKAIASQANPPSSPVGE